MTKKPLHPAYGEIRVTLPKFLIIFLRQTVADANKARDNDPRWTVSELLESLLCTVVSEKELDAVGKKSAEFRREAEAWLRLITKRESGTRGRQ